ncbi:hypothetical protein [Rhodoferax sp. BLA1]|uniref:hypothetical protein n=1 Tax=Rhodoferax sp. BLA1 TaxID=2576062 RepID=UPI0015D3B678|nr:hypothetical protein [Rhodoferax sp. BLA1]
MITDSTYTEGPAQADGRRYVKEVHTDDTGKTYEFEWLGSQDVALVLAGRASALTVQISAQRAADALVAGTSLPLTKLKWERLFTDAEWAAAQVFNDTFESLDTLTAEQKIRIKRGLREYVLADYISKSDPSTIFLVTLYESFGVIGVGRAAEILA